MNQEDKAKASPALHRAAGRRPAKIHVTTVGNPPLDGAAAFARLLAASHNKNPAAPASQECGDPAFSPRPDK